MAAKASCNGLCLNMLTAICDGHSALTACWQDGGRTVSVGATKEHERPQASHATQR